MVKLAAFNCLCNIFKRVSSYSLADVPALFWEISEPEVEILFRYIGAELKFE